MRSWSFSVKKINGNLIFNDFGGYETRNPSTFWCIQKADEKYHWSDFHEIIIRTGDYEDNNYDYTYSKKDNYNNLVPDFNFHSWPQVGINDYDKCIDEINLAGLHRPTINKVGWIGNTQTNFMRNMLLRIGNDNKELFDIFDMRWKNTGETLLSSTQYISIPDLVKRYSILIDIEGNGYSGRLKHLLWSNRPVLLVDREHKEFFFQYLKKWVHYIPVKRDLSDLIEKTKWCLNNYDKALVIADNALEISKLYLTRDACYNQWNQIISKHIIK